MQVHRTLESPGQTERQPITPPIRIGEVFNDHISPSLYTGLGQNAVKLALKQSYDQQRGDQLEHGDDERLAKQLQKARDELEELTPRQARLFQQLVLDQPNSPWLEWRLDMPNRTYRPTSLIQHLTDRKQDGSYVLPDRVFMNFLEWHNHVLATKQHELTDRTPSLRAEYAAKIGQAVWDGWMPPSVLHKLSRLQKTQLIIDDGLHTTVDDTEGAAFNDGSAILIAPNKVARPGHLLWHEFSHLLDGQSPAADGERVGFNRGLYRVFGAGEGGRAMDEALIEHVASSLENGAIDAIDPPSSR